MNIYASIDIGGTNTRFAVVQDKEIIYINKFPTDPLQPYKTLDLIVEEFTRSEFDITAVGLSCPGPADNQLGLIIDPPNLKGWHNLNIKEYLENKTSLSFYMENDANLAALGESSYYKCKLLQYITISTGIGGGLIYDGEIFEGAHFRAQELANIIVEPNGFSLGVLAPGSIESLSSGTGITAQAKASGACINHAEQVYALARQGDAICAEIFKHSIEMLANMIAASYAFIDPSIVVLGGGIIINNPALVDELQELVRNKVYPTMRDYVDIRVCHYGDDSGIYGGAIYAEKKHTTQSN